MVYIAGNPGCGPWELGGVIDGCILLETPGVGPRR